MNKFFDTIKCSYLSYYEIINGYSKQEHIRPLIGRMLKKFDSLEKLIAIKERDAKITSNLQVINLKDVNLEMKKTLPLIIVSNFTTTIRKTGNSIQSRCIS